VGVNLRCCHFGVSEQLLHETQVHSGIQKMRGEGVTQGVGVNSPAQNALGVVSHQTAQIAVAQRLSIAVDKERIGFSDTGFCGLEVSLYGFCGITAERDNALLAAFSAHTQEACFKVNVLDAQ